VIDLRTDVDVASVIPRPRGEHVPAPRAEARPESARPRPQARRLLWAAAGAAVLGVGYVPAARVPIIADDLQGLQEIYAVSDGSLWRALTHGLSEGQEAGHFNPIGQALGAAYHFAAYTVSAAAGVSPQYFDVLASVALILLAVAGATSVLVWGLAGSARPGYWPSFALVCAITAVTLQLHAPWSNDPVVSFGLAGWGSAALGFWTIGLALRAISPGVHGRGSLVGCSLTAAVCVWYYEMLVAAVAAVAVAVLLTGLRTRDRAVRRRCAVLAASAVGLPAVLFVLGRRLAAASERSYGGTTTHLGWSALDTWGSGMVGALPGGGWKFLVDMSGPPVVRTTSLLLGVLLCALAAGTAVAGARSAATSPVPTTGPGTRPGRGPVVVLVAIVGTFWALATATHSVTDKYIAEIRHPGQVYLFYAVGVLAVALLLALCLLRMPRRVSQQLRLALLPLAGIFVLLQVTINMQVADVARSQVPYNAPLVALSTDGHARPAERCAALDAWSAQGWPEYYARSIRASIQENYHRTFGEPFCPPGD